jgi:hypothetical protein
MKNKSTLQSVLIGLFLVLAFALATRSARAQTPTPIPQTHWTDLGSPNHDWFLFSNWDNGVPDSSTDAYINRKQALINTPNGGLGATARTLYLGFSQGDSGSVQVDGYLNYLGIFPDCTNNVPGDIYVGYRGSGTLAITNQGTVLTTHGYIAALQNPTRPNSYGTVKIQNSIWHLKPECGNSAGVYIGCTAPCTPTNGQGGTGLLDVGSNSLVEVEGNNVDAPGVNVGLSGTLSGSGLVYLLFGSTQLSDTVNVYGTLAPTGTLTMQVQGQLALQPQASTNFHVTTQTNDFVNVLQVNSVGGSVALGGRVSVTMTGSTFTPGMRFHLLHADGGRGTTYFRSESITHGINNACIKPTIQYDDSANNVDLYLCDCSGCPQ